MHFALQEYLEELEASGDITRNNRCPQVNAVGFIKDFMKEETICDVDFAEKSKMDRLEKSVIDDDCEYREL